MLVSPRLVDLSQATEDNAIVHFELRDVKATKAPVTAALEFTRVLNYDCIQNDASGSPPESSVAGEVPPHCNSYLQEFIGHKCVLKYHSG